MKWLTSFSAWKWEMDLKQVILQRSYFSKSQMIYTLFIVHRLYEIQNIFSTLSFPFVCCKVKIPCFAFQEAQRSEVLEAKIFSSSLGTTGICFLTGDYQYFVVNNIDEVKVKPLQCPFCKWLMLSCISYNLHLQLIYIKQRNL